MTLQELKHDYDKTFDMVLDQMDKVSELVVLIKKPYMTERNSTSLIKELKEEQRTLKELNHACQIIDQMIQDKYTVREMYIVQQYQLKPYNPYNA